MLMQMPTNGRNILLGARAHSSPSRSHKKGTCTYTKISSLSTPCRLRHLPAVLSCVSFVVTNYVLSYWIEVKNKSTLLHFLTIEHTCLDDFPLAEACWSWGRCGATANAAPWLLGSFFVRKAEKRPLAGKMGFKREIRLI